MKQSDGSSKRGVRGVLGDSWRLHLRKPILLVFGPLAALLLYSFDWLTGGGQPLAGDIARLFAFPPLDRFADLGVAEGGSTGWAIVPGLLARVLISSLFISAALAVPLTAKKLLRVGAVYVVASLSWLITYLMSVAYFAQLEASTQGT
ncbi:MAG TPA: hypothetical protein VND22_03010, partial [Actinomycetota bacterium]|nr:hypothetical protein [Actinomycetota bacterium]